MSSGRRPGERYDGDLRQALVTAAAQALAEVGVDRLSLRDVARRVGVSHAAPAHHFGDKTGLLTAVATAGFQRFGAALTRALGSAGSTPEAVLGALTTAYVRFGERHRGYFRVMFDAAVVDVTDPDYVVASDAQFASLRGVVEQLQRQGWRTGENPAALAAGCWAFAHGLAVLRGQGSLGRHWTKPSPEALGGIAIALLADPV